jgi:polyvinyl alcohol dehydrogenase (cytochrome)
MAPPGYWGSSVWGGTPTVDAQRGAVYVSTGNNYSVPLEAAQCVLARGLNEALDCLPADDYFDSVVALDLDTGAVRWATRVQSYDSFNLACAVPEAAGQGNCPLPAGPDYDLSSGTNLFTAVIDGRSRDLVGAGQKSGIYWALDRDTGSVVWRTPVGPGSSEGGIMWGAAFDGKYLYMSNANGRRAVHTLVPSGQTTLTGTWSALDPATGQIIWQTPAPEDQLIPGPMAWTPGPVTIANGVLYAGSMQGNGPMYALDASDGSILWTFASGGSVNSAPAVAQGMVYWGSGYTRFGFGTANDKLYAFTVAP